MHYPKTLSAMMHTYAWYTSLGSWKKRPCMRVWPGLLDSRSFSVFGAVCWGFSSQHSLMSCIGTRQASLLACTRRLRLVVMCLCTSRGLFHSSEIAKILLQRRAVVVHPNSSQIPTAARTFMPGSGNDRHTRNLYKCIGKKTVLNMHFMYTMFSAPCCCIRATKK